MMIPHSENRKELFEALRKAQAGDDPSAETKAIRAIYLKRVKSGCQHEKIPLHLRILDSIAFGLHDCWHWIRATNRFGYGRLTYKGRGEMAHRLSYMVFRGPIPDGMFVLHNCDNPSCINPDHLRLGTYSDNRRDCISRGRWSAKMRRGVEHQTNKFQPEWIPEIKRMRELGYPYIKIAPYFGVKTMCIWNGLNRRFV